MLFAAKKIPKHEIKHVEIKPDVAKEITKEVTVEQPTKPIQLQEESDDDDDINKIKSDIIKTLSKIEQAEVD